MRPQAAAQGFPGFVKMFREPGVTDAELMQSRERSLLGHVACGFDRVFELTAKGF